MGLLFKVFTSSVTWFVGWLKWMLPNFFPSLISGDNSTGRVCARAGACTLRFKKEWIWHKLHQSAYTLTPFSALLNPTPGYPKCYSVAKFLSNNKNGQISSILWTINTFRKKVADSEDGWEVFQRCVSVREHAEVQLPELVGSCTWFTQ